MSLRILLISLILVLNFVLSSMAQLPNTWTQKTDFGGLTRTGATGFSIGTKGYIGLGSNALGISGFSDFWEYDQVNDTWTQKADFAGTYRYLACGFAINDKGYIGTGNNNSNLKDFWEYDPVTNSWIQKANFSGLPRQGAVGFSIGLKGYIGLGYGNTGMLNDFWEYDPLSDQWTQKSSFIGTARVGAVGFNIGNKGFVGTGYDGVSLRKDFWEYNPQTDIWTEKTSFGGVVRSFAFGYGMINKGYIGLGGTNGSYTNDFWEYDPSIDLWTQKANFEGSARRQVAGFGISGKIFLGTGFNGSFFKDFWEYTPSCLEPTIISQPFDQTVTYGGDVSFSVISNNGLSYQWQEDIGSGFSNITDGGIYSNSTTAELIISLPTVQMSGYKYRCVISGSCISEVYSNGNATLIVLAKPIIITANTGQFKLYGDSDPANYEYTYAPALEGSDVLTGELARIAGEDAGYYSYTLGSLVASSNYLLSVSSSTTFEIIQRNLTIIAENKTKCYDGAIYGSGYTVTYNGFVNNETQSVLGGTLIFGGTAITAIDPGIYTIIPSGLISINYAISYVDGTLLIESSPSPTISGLNSLCAGSTNVQYNTEAGFSNYVWTISYGGVITSGLNSNQVTVDWGTAGSRNISVNYQNSSGCPSSIPANYNVSVLSVPDPIITGDNSVCSGTSGITYSTQPNYTNYNWVVSTGGNISSGIGTNIINVNWTGSGNQTVSVEFTNDLGCQPITPTVFNVEVAPKPSAAGPVVGSNSVCAGSNALTYSVATISNTISYEWTLPPGATISAGAGTATITVDFAANALSGIIKVMGINDCGAGMSSPDFNVQVNPIPSTPVILRHGDTLVSSSNIGNQWYLNGLVIQGATEKEHIAVYTGTYHAVVTQNNCSSEPSNSILVLPVSLDKAIDDVSIVIYPNPSTGIFNIQTETNNSESFDIEVFNNVGSVIFKQDAVSINGPIMARVDLIDSPAGVYTIVLQNKTNKVIRKIIKLR